MIRLSSILAVLFFPHLAIAQTPPPDELSESGSTADRAEAKEDDPASAAPASPTVAPATVAPASPIGQSGSGATIDEASSRGSSDGRTRAKDQIVMPAGEYTLGGSLSFLTAPKSPFSADDSLRFTDVVFLGLEARYAIKGRAEVSASVALLPKQPSFADEFVVQGASISTRVGFARRYAGWARVGGGPTFGSAGKWAQITAGLEAQKPIHDFVQFHGQFGINTVGLFGNGKSGNKLQFRDPAWFTEAIVGADLVTFDKRTFAAWIGASFHFPLVELSESASMDIDPQTRANFHIGTVFSGIKDWDLSIDISIIDRGDVKDASTTLPILIGGFDQTMINFGITRRYKQKKPRPGLMMIGR